MKVIVLLLLAYITLVKCFNFVTPITKRISKVNLHMSDETEIVSSPASSKPSTSSSSPKASSGSSKRFELVPLDKENISNAATATGGILGFVLGGPVLAAILAAVTNYVSKKDGDSGDALRGVGKTVVESYNYINTLNEKYEITGKVTATVDETVSKYESESEIVGKVKSAVSTATEKFDDLNKEFDLVDKGKQVLKAAGTFSDAALDKLLELNQKYDFVSSAKRAASSAVEKAKEAADKARD